MTKDEMKNRISMAIKDPILQQGFEIICKELADLQKEVIDLRQDKKDLIFVRNAKADHINELKDQIADIKANCDLAIEGRDIKIKELELELTVEKDQLQEEVELHLHAEDYIKELEKENKTLEGCLLAEQEHTLMLEQQIEEMKNCNNCKGYYTKQCLGCEDYCNWELKEIKENGV